jgi:hypothetical protein
VVNIDGGVAPCTGAFYRQDDFGELKTSAEDIGRSTFREVWNSRSHQEARRFFRSRTGSEASKKLIRFDCPVTIMYEKYKSHLAAGGDPSSFEGGYSFNDGFNYFFNHRPARPEAMPQ